MTTSHEMTVTEIEKHTVQSFLENELSEKGHRNHGREERGGGKGLA